MAMFLTPIWLESPLAGLSDLGMGKQSHLFVLFPGVVRVGHWGLSILEKPRSAHDLLAPVCTSNMLWVPGEAPLL